MKILANYFFNACIIFSISACSSLPKESNTNVEWEQHKAQLSQINTFQVSGKLSYRDSNNKTSLYFHWKHSPEISELRFIHFLGSTLLTLTMTPDVSKLVTKEGDVFEDQNADLLLARLTGLDFPVAQMKNWIKGQPTQADSFIFNDTNTLQSLTKKNHHQVWTLVYDQYQIISELPLPYKMTLDKEDAKVKIVISKWVINS